LQPLAFSFLRVLFGFGCKPSGLASICSPKSCCLTGKADHFRPYWISMSGRHKPCFDSADFHREGPA